MKHGKHSFPITHRPPATPGYCFHVKVPSAMCLKCSQESLPGVEV